MNQYIDVGDSYFTKQRAKIFHVQRVTSQFLLEESYSCKS